MNASVSEKSQSLTKVYAFAPLIGFAICFVLGVIFSPVDRSGMPMNYFLASSFGAGLFPGLVGFCVGKRIAKK